MDLSNRHFIADASELSAPMLNDGRFCAMPHPLADCLARVSNPWRSLSEGPLIGGFQQLHQLIGGDGESNSSVGFLGLSIMFFHIEA